MKESIGRNPFGAGTVFQCSSRANPGGRSVAIPLEQGQFFNITGARRWRADIRRNPFGAGTVFQFTVADTGKTFPVAIPLEQGRFFN